MTSPILLGIDTGGTYTDAVLFREGEGVIAKAKSLTTRHDLADGIAGAHEDAFGAGPRQAGQHILRLRVQNCYQEDDDG